MALSNHAENLILDTLFGVNDTNDKASSSLDLNNVYIVLFTSETTDSGGGNEVSTSGTGYARLAVANNDADNKWTDAVGGVKKNAVELTVGTGSSAAGDWGTITHVGIFDASTGGNLLVHGPLTASKTVSTGDVFKFAINDLQITLN